jgi:hypothetical protein
MKRYGIAFLLVLILTVCLVGAPDALAQGKAMLENPLKAESLSAFLSDLFKAIVKIGLPIIVLFIVWSGFLFIKAQGNSSELATAKKNFMYVVLGTTIFLGSWAIAEMIAATLRQLGV